MSARQEAAGAASRPAGAAVYKLPRSPRDVGDTVQLRFVILGPEAASSSGKPSKVARSFLDKDKALDRPRPEQVPARGDLEVEGVVDDACVTAGSEQASRPHSAGRRGA